MTETDLAAAVGAVVHEWMSATQPSQQVVALSSPATLAAELGLTVKASLASAGFAAETVREFVLRAPYVHLRDVFVAGALADTPMDFLPVPESAGTMAGCAAVLAIHGALQMETVSYGTENGGHLFVNLVSMAGQGIVADKSRKSMRGHTDAVSFPFNGHDDVEDARIAPSPDLVTLVGLRNPDAVPTRLMSLDAVLARMRPQDIAELKKPQYSIRSQKTFIRGMKALLGREVVVQEEPVLIDAEKETYIRYSHSSVVPSVEGGPAEEASNRLEGACNEVGIHVAIQPGDLLIINNRRSLHGRGEVGGSVGGQSRWLIRAYGLDTTALPAQKRHLGGRPAHVLYP